jgi:Fe-Mn family superoxide dismutase
MAFTLPSLPYPFEALEPHIDRQTMEIHHGRHHKAYVDNANKALDGTTWAELPPEQVIAKLSELPDDKRGPVRNNAGGHVNHSLFWTLMAPAGKGGGGQPTGALADAIKSTFGSFDQAGGFKEKFAAAGTGRFGSGWAWLVVSPAGKLEIGSTANQDSPLMGKAIAGIEGAPILGVDVWEHAYYLKYQNKRPDYIAAWWNVVNWGRVAELFGKARR